MIQNVKIKPSNYIPPKTLGEGLARVKASLGITGSRIEVPPRKGVVGIGRLYKTMNGDTVYMTWGELHKTKDIVDVEKNLNYKDYDTFAGTVLRIRHSATCGSRFAKPNQLMQIMRARLYSDAVVDSKGNVHKPIKAITDFKIFNSEEGKPVVVYGCGKNAGVEGVAASIKEIKSEDVPKAYTGKNMPDGNIVYYTKDTERDGERSVEIKMYEVGLDVPIL